MNWLWLLVPYSVGMVLLGRWLFPRTKWETEVVEPEYGYAYIETDKFDTISVPFEIPRGLQQELADRITAEIERTIITGKPSPTPVGIVRCLHLRRRHFEPEFSVGDESDHTSECVDCGQPLRSPANV